MLKAHVKTLEEVQEQFRSLYVKTDDGYALQVDESPLQQQLSDLRSKIDEFRNNNRDLFSAKKQLEDQLKGLEGLDPKKYEEAMKAMAKLEEAEVAQLLKDGKFDDVIRLRTQTMRNELQNQITAKDNAYKELNEKYTQATQKLSSLLIETHIGKAVSEVGSVRKGAMADIINRAKTAFVVADDMTLKPNGLFNAKGDPMTAEEWAKSLLSDAPYLFEPGQGGGASGGAKNNSSSGGVKVIPNDPFEIGKNLADIAAGKAEVAGS